MSFVGTLRSATYSVAETYRAANPTVLRHVFQARPEGQAETPFAFVGDVRVRLFHDSGTRRWEGEADLVVCDSTPVNDEAMDRLDVIAAALVDAFSDQPHAYGDNTVAEPIGLASLAVVQGDGLTYEGRTITVGRIYMLEGR